jgi:hypothetical protein
VVGQRQSIATAVGVATQASEILDTRANQVAGRAGGVGGGMVT